MMLPGLLICQAKPCDVEDCPYLFGYGTSLTQSVTPSFPRPVEGRRGRKEAGIEAGRDDVNGGNGGNGTHRDWLWTETKKRGPTCHSATHMRERGAGETEYDVNAQLVKGVGGRALPTLRYVTKQRMLIPKF